MKRVMSHLGKLAIGAILWVATVNTCSAFALLGRGGAPGQPPFPAWQLAAYDNFLLDYAFAGDIGGPMMPDEGYRWNIPVIHYAFDQSFINYFGQRGMREVEKAIAIFNNLPPMNQIPTDGRFLFVNGQPVPFQTARDNFEARDLGILDVKSWVMGYIIEEMGLAEAERWTWTLLGRDAITDVITNYTVGHRNFDPITIRPSSFVNEVLYTFEIFESGPPNRTEAIEFQVDPLDFGFSSVASQLLLPGRFYTGLTHDDVGGLRWLYNTNRLAVENLETNVVAGRPVLGGAGGSPWAPFFVFTNTFASGTNFVFATNLVRTALRPGINKLTFRRVNYDSLLGNLLVPVTNRYTDTYFSNSVTVIQPVERVIQVPDLIFSAGRLGLAGNLFPALTSRTSTAGWQNNDIINGVDQEVDGGPGVIEGPVVIQLTDQLPFFTDPSLFGSPFITTPRQEPGLPFGWSSSVVWGSFDGTTDAPVIYPFYGDITIDDLRNFVSGGGN